MLKEVVCGTGREYRSIHHSGDMKRFPAIFLKFLCTLLPWLAELSAESAQQQTLMSRLLLHDSLGVITLLREVTQWGESFSKHLWFAIVIVFLAEMGRIPCCGRPESSNSNI